MSRVSVVIPAYNHERYVEACLESVRASTYPDKEIIIIDDGSTDATASVIRAWIDQHGAEIPVTFRSRPNKGRTVTLNEAIALARGTFIAACASDDLFLPDSMSERVAYLAEHPDLGAVFGDCHIVDEQGKLLYQSSLHSIHKTNTSLYKTPRGVALGIIWRWAVAGPSLIVRRDLFNELGCFDETRVVEDWDVYLRLAARYKLGFIDTPVAAYRVHDANSCMAPTAQDFILKELIATALKRAPEFSFPLNGLLYAKAFFYTLRRLKKFLAH